MRALITVAGESPVVQDVPVPKPQEGEILVKVHYVAQNPTDWKGAKRSPPGRIVGCDFAGSVADPNGSQWREGQRVGGWVHGQRVDPLRGAFAEYLVTDASLVFAIPDPTSYQEAAVVPLAFATAVQALYQRLKLPEPTAPAESPIPVLVHGGASSVGLYAIQLARLSGLFVIATGSKRNHELLQKLGADAVVDYNDSNWPEQVRNLTQDKLQHALDTVGGAPDAAKAISSSSGGHLISITPRSTFQIDPALTKVKVEATVVKTVFGLSLSDSPYPKMGFDYCGGPTPEDKAFWEKYLGLLPELLEQGKVKPNPPREFGGIDDIVRGFQKHEQGKVRAEKLVYKIA
ncbi:GroES-like protein [Thozetella sp. PMI_491]|nr:GroES-like protein [Thozetella sp. PMI_491]